MYLVALLSLVVLSQSYCSYQCGSCVDQNVAGIVSSQCTSCIAGYFLEGYRCYRCNDQHYEICQSYFQSQKRQHTIIAVAVSASVVTLILIILCCCACKKTSCCNQDQFLNSGRERENEHARTYQDYNLNAKEVSVVQLIVVQKNLWKKDNSKLKQEQVCVICLDSSVFLKTSCQHSFHPNCIWEWVAKNQGCCPLCKSPKIFPSKIYCRSCFLSHFQISSIPENVLLQVKEWSKCEDCKSIQVQI